jgi:hypothetical protein
MHEESYILQCDTKIVCYIALNFTVCQEITSFAVFEMCLLLTSQEVPCSVQLVILYTHTDARERVCTYISLAARRTTIT